MSKIDHPGWKPEGFMREQLSVEDAAKLLAEMGKRVPSHFENYGAGIFCHPHEIVGCMYGQIMKLSQAADASIYDGDLTKFRERCMKTMMAIFVGLASVDQLAELRNGVVANMLNPEVAAGTESESEPVANDGVTTDEPEHIGPPRDNQGKITRISTQVGDAGYDPEIHLNQELKILCDGIHIPTAHTADTEAGTVWYYEKNAKGRIKTLASHGKVEIRGI